MTTDPAPKTFLQKWPVQRILLLLVALALLGLMSDIRVDHVAVVHENSIAWTPIIYAGVMALLSGLTVLLWNRLARLILLWLFLLAFAVGFLGFWLHNQNRGLKKVMTDTFAAWTDPELKHSRGPPETAPLAFCGIGLLGMLACARGIK